MKDVRQLATVLLGLFAALMLLITMTVPVIAATGPAILTVAAAAGAYFAWPRSKSA